MVNDLHPCSNVLARQCMMVDGESKYVQDYVYKGQYLHGLAGIPITTRVCQHSSRHIAGPMC